MCGNRKGISEGTRRPPSCCPACRNWSTVGTTPPVWAVYNDGGLRVVKSKGPFKRAGGHFGGGASPSPAPVGIGHTRWATHGAPSDINSHPQVSDGGKFAVVHNGIIENYLYLKNHLIRRGVEFVSETDTEVVAQMLEHYYQGDVLEAIRKVISKVEGQLRPGHHLCRLARRSSSPCGKTALSSSAWGRGRTTSPATYPAILSRTRDIYRLKDQEIAVLTREGVAFYDQELEPITKEMERVQWDVAAAEKARLRALHDEGDLRAARRLCGKPSPPPHPGRPDRFRRHHTDP